MKKFLKLFTKDVNVPDNSPLAIRRAILEKLQDTDTVARHQEKFAVAKEFAEKNYAPQKAGAND